MPTYRNGYVPEGLLHVFKRGHNSTDGDWYHGLPPATYRRHLALVDRAYKRTGRTLAPGDGWTTYRPMHAQEIARRIWGNGAAAPGTSSHGGFWEGRQTMAVDYSNWAWVYQNHGGQAAFFEDCRAVGLTPGMIMRSRGYPDEPWHVIDTDPWAAVPAAVEVKPFEVEKESDMEAYVIVPSGSVVHLVPGGRHVFSSQQEYETFQREVEFIRERNGLDMFKVPPLGSVVGVSWATYERLRKNFGVPDDVRQADEGAPIDLDALASKIAEKSGYSTDAVRAAVRAELASLTLRAG